MYSFPTKFMAEARMATTVDEVEAVAVLLGGAVRGQPAGAGEEVDGFPSEDLGARLLPSVLDSGLASYFREQLAEDWTCVVLEPGSTR